MKYASVSVKFPIELDTEIERFLDETGVYTNKSEFIKEACRTHLRELNDDTAIAALRLQRMLDDAEQNQDSDAELERTLSALGENVDAVDLSAAVESARADTEEQVYGTDS